MRQKHLRVRSGSGHKTREAIARSFVFAYSGHKPESEKSYAGCTFRKKHHMRWRIATLAMRRRRSKDRLST